MLVNGLGHDRAGVLRPSKVTAKTRTRVLLWSIRLFFDALVCSSRLPFSVQAWYGFCRSSDAMHLFVFLLSPAVALLDERLVVGPVGQLLLAVIYNSFGMW